MCVLVHVCECILEGEHGELHAQLLRMKCMQVWLLDRALRGRGKEANTKLNGANGWLSMSMVFNLSGHFSGIKYPLKRAARPCEMLVVLGSALPFIKRVAVFVRYMLHHPLKQTPLKKGECTPDAVYTEMPLPIKSTEKCCC